MSKKGENAVDGGGDGLVNFVVPASPGISGFPKIIGIGVDIVETARIESSIEKLGDRFLNRVFTQDEIAFCSAAKFPARHYSARFAAKEAVSKAFGTGIGGSMGWREIEVCRGTAGSPSIRLHGAAEEFAVRMGVSEILISLSHADHYAVANALVIATSGQGDPGGRHS